MNNNPIGIFDSGIGGLSILKEVMKLLPQESIVYFADSGNCPYGGKTKSEVCMLSKRGISSLLEREVKLIVIACNTVTVSCIDELRREFPKIPIIGIVPVVKAAALASKSKRIGILSTSTTSKSEYQADLINNFADTCEVVNVGTDELVPFIEKGEVNSDRFIITLEKILHPFKQAHVDTIALGCSHFPLVKNEIQQLVGRDVLLLDSGGAVARHVKRILEHEDLFSGSEAQYEFITSGDTKAFQNAVQRIIGTVDGTIRSI